MCVTVLHYQCISMYIGKWSTLVLFILGPSLLEMFLEIWKNGDWRSSALHHQNFSVEREGSVGASRH